jgi:Domain of unknown function (DUF4192)
LLLVDQIIVRGGPNDLIAFALYRLGFRPREGIVVVGLNGPRRRTGMVARLDLPPPAHVPAALARVVVALRRVGDGEALVLVFSEVDAGHGADDGTDGTDGSGDGPDPLLAHPGVARAVRRTLRRARIGVLDVVAVSRDAYRSYLCRDLRCCPPGGTPMTAVLDTVTAAHMVAAGRSLADDEKGVVADVAPEPDGSLRRRAVDACLGAATGCSDGPTRLAALRRWRALLHGDEGAGLRVPTAADVAGVVVALQDHLVRDAVLLTLVPGSGTVPDELVATGVPVPGSAAAVLFDALLAAPPEEDLLWRGERLLALVARAAPAGRRGDALAVLAWASWWSEGGVRPRLLARLALDDDPTHRLASLVVGTLDAAVPPPWLRVGSG